MLKISRLADYATWVLSVLARSPDQHFSAALIALETPIRAPTVSKVLKLLHEAHLVNSKQGVNGGYQLARAPDTITIAEIVTAIDGKPAMTACSRGDNICAHDKQCGLRHNWRTINKVVMHVLSQLTLAEMQQPIQRTWNDS